MFALLHAELDGYALELLVFELAISKYRVYTVGVNNYVISNLALARSADNKQ